jgi:hypothetical protein
MSQQQSPFVTRRWRSKSARAREAKATAWWYWNVYLRSSWWRSFRAEYLRRVNNKCEYLGCSELATEIHHLTYGNLWNEQMGDVIAFCRRHHEQMHKPLTQGSRQLDLFMNAGIKLSPMVHHRASWPEYLKARSVRGVPGCDQHSEHFKS